MLIIIISHIGVAVCLSAWEREWGQGQCYPHSPCCWSACWLGWNVADGRKTSSWREHGNSGLPLIVWPDVPNAKRRVAFVVWVLLCTGHTDKYPYLGPPSHTTTLRTEDDSQVLISAVDLSTPCPALFLQSPGVCFLIQLNNPPKAVVAVTTWNHFRVQEAQGDS